MKNVHLVLPHVKFKSQYNEMVNEWLNAKENLPFPLKPEWRNINEVVNNLHGYATGAVPSTILIKHTTFFFHCFYNDKV